MSPFTQWQSLYWRHINVWRGRIARGRKGEEETRKRNQQKTRDECGWPLKDKRAGPCQLLWTSSWSRAIMASPWYLSVSCSDWMLSSDRCSRRITGSSTPFSVESPACCACQDHWLSFIYQSLHQTLPTQSSVDESILPTVDCTSVLNLLM